MTTIVYSGGNVAEKVVRMMMTKKISISLVRYWALSNRVLLIKFKEKSTDRNVAQEYAPTAEAEETEIKKIISITRQNEKTM